LHCLHCPPRLWCDCIQGSCWAFLWLSSDTESSRNWVESTRTVLFFFGT
jgi:hypothetical protein